MALRDASSSSSAMTRKTSVWAANSRSYAGMYEDGVSDWIPAIIAWDCTCMYLLSCRACIHRVASEGCCHIDKADSAVLFALPAQRGNCLVTDRSTASQADYCTVPRKFCRLSKHA